MGGAASVGQAMTAALPRTPVSPKASSDPARNARWESEATALDEINRQRELQNQAIQYVVSNIYYSMPVKTMAISRSGAEAASGEGPLLKPAFITVDLAKVQEAAEQSTSGSGSALSLEDDVKNFPESVVVDEHGDIHITPSPCAETGAPLRKISGAALLATRVPPEPLPAPGRW